jgi:type II secretory pathway component PulJ
MTTAQMVVWIDITFFAALALVVLGIAILALLALIAFHVRKSYRTMSQVGIWSHDQALQLQAVNANVTLLNRNLGLLLRSMPHQAHEPEPIDLDTHTNEQPGLDEDTEVWGNPKQEEHKEGPGLYRYPGPSSME